MKIKDVLTFVLIILAGILLFITNIKKNSNKVIIKGKISNPIGDQVKFDTQMTPFSSSKDTTYSTTLNQNGTFTIFFELDSASYLNFSHGAEVTAMYIKPGDKINLTIDTELFDETIKYQGSPYSSYLAERYLLDEGKDFFGEIYFMSTTQEYKDILEDYKASIINKVKKVSDSVFVNNEIRKLEENIKSAIERQKKLLEENSANARAYMWEAREIGRNFNFYTAIDSLNSIDFKKMTEQYKAAFESSLNKLTDIKFLVESKEKITKTANYWIEQKKAVNNIPKTGEAAIDFAYPEQNGDTISLSSLKNNLVYVDVWATWCGPCKAEIPSLQQLEKDYQKQNIIFMSVSVDTNKEAWKKMIEEKKLGGIQLWADGGSKIKKDYAIFGIPRFMLFDTKGDIISTNAPRPSSSNIRELFDSNL